MSQKQKNEKPAAKLKRIYRKTTNQIKCTICQINIKKS